MTPEAFARVADVSRETIDRLSVYAELLRRWQRRINLVGESTMADLWRRHMLDSVQLTKYIPDAAVITDLGSGAGFPGLVIAIALDREVHLIESNGRKCAFLQEVARETGAPAKVRHGRIQDVEPWASRVITARALAPVTKLLGLAFPFLQLASGEDPICLFLKGARAEEELTEAAKRWHMEIERFSSASGEAGAVLCIRGVSRE
jgi:16S rRNA (guanine527-N7)-methyltransferase